MTTREAHPHKGAQGLGRGVPHPVGNPDRAGEGAVHRDVYCGLAGILQPSCLARVLAERDTQCLHHGGIAERHRLVRYAAMHASASDGLRVARREVGRAFRLGRLDDRLGERVLGAPLQRRREREQPRPIDVAQRNDVGEGGPAFGERAGLVDDQQVRLGQTLQCLGVAHQNARLSAAPGGHHDRHRRCQPERTRAGDDQHAHGCGQGVGQGGRRAGHQPADGRQHGNGDHGRHEDTGNPVGERLDRRAAALRPCHQRDDAGQRGFGPDPLRPHHEAARPGERAAGERIARRLSPPGAARR